MKLQSKRIVASLVGMMIIVLVILAEFSLLPLEPTSLSYWLGFVAFFSIGAFLIMSLKGGMSRVGGVTVGVLGFSLIVLSRSYAAAGDAAAAGPGLFVGMLARYMVVAFADTKTAYCNICKTRTWMERRHGKWYCVSGNHFVVDSKKEASLETVAKQESPTTDT
jgi:hypothetical protein